jgi:hypothetical protein
MARCDRVGTARLFATFRVAPRKKDAPLPARQELADRSEQARISE